MLLKEDLRQLFASSEYELMEDRDNGLKVVKLVVHPNMRKWLALRSIGLSRDAADELTRAEKQLVAEYNSER